MQRTCDVAIIGGGAIGSAIATFLLGDPAFGGSVVVLERDPSYARASSALSASSIPAAVLHAGEHPDVALQLRLHVGDRPPPPR